MYYKTFKFKNTSTQKFKGTTQCLYVSSYNYGNHGLNPWTSHMAAPVTDWRSQSQHTWEINGLFVKSLHLEELQELSVSRNVFPPFWVCKQIKSVSRVRMIVKIYHYRSINLLSSSWPIYTIRDSLNRCCNQLLNINLVFTP